MISTTDANVCFKIRTKRVFTTLEMNEFFPGGSEEKNKTRTNKLSSICCGLAYESPYRKQLEIKKRFFKIRQKIAFDF